MPVPDLPTLSRALVRLKARWRAKVSRVRRLAAEADRIAKSQVSGLLARRQAAAPSLRRPARKPDTHYAWARWSATADELAGVVTRLFVFPL